jgi:hypothetical protein
MRHHRFPAIVAALSVAIGTTATGHAADQQAASTRYDVNPGLLAAIGPSLRNDLPLPRLQDTSPATTIGTGTSATAESASSGGQVLYDVNTRSRFTPYLGLGGPTARLDRLRSPVVTTNNTGDPVQGYQGVAGLAYNLDRNVQFNVGYRYSNFHRQDTPVPENTEIDSQPRDGRAMLLFRYELGGNRP